ncbi:hypothetical protein DIE22_12810 [Burkholderia sp. Bp9142]|nr:hypothetical protein DIE22_12810 [Burkholderia sp. Bp9142]RQR55012.1 hypothetical protein DIE21_06105 [Burkholderia sp. Bp9140]
MHVACKQCSENPPRAYCAFVANCNSTRLQPPCGRAARPRDPPCGSRDSVRPAKSRRTGRSVLPDPASMACTPP